MIPELILPDDDPKERAQPPMVYVQPEPIWEYHCMTRQLEEEKPPSVEELDELGAEGWELAGIVHQAPAVYFYFKRLKR